MHLRNRITEQQFLNILAAVRGILSPITNHKDINTLARIHKHIHVSAKLAQPNIIIHSFTVVVLLLLGPVGVTLSDDDVLYPRLRNRSDLSLGRPKLFRLGYSISENLKT